MTRLLTLKNTGFEGQPVPAGIVIEWNEEQHGDTMKDFIEAGLVTADFARLPSGDFAQLGDDGEPFGRPVPAGQMRENAEAGSYVPVVGLGPCATPPEEPQSSQAKAKKVK